MILQSLTDLYDRLATEPESRDSIPKPGYSLQKCSFAVVIRPDGSLAQFRSLLQLNGKKSIPQMLLVPGMNKPPGQGINPCFLWDNSGYMLGYKAEDDKPERTRESFEAFRKRHLEAEADINSHAYSAVCAFLRNWSPEQAAERQAELNDIIGSFGVFQLEGTVGYVHDDDAVLSYWADQSSAGGSDDSIGFCLVTGKKAPIARLHEPKIKGVMGAQSAGALLVSFNDQAYESLGKAQGQNAPVSESAAFKYTNALNYQLNRSDRRVFLGDATVTFWSKRPTQMEGMMAGFLDEGYATQQANSTEARDDKRANEVRQFLMQLRDGHADAEAISDDPNMPFFVLGLSPNASRISVRFWHESTVAEMQQRLHNHLRDVALVGLRDHELPPNIRRIVLATGRADFKSGSFKGYDSDSISPVLAGAVAQAVFSGGLYPRTLLGAMIGRLRSDGYISHTRVAAIKACLARNYRIKKLNEEVPVALDRDRKDPGYVCGRIFALLEKAQQDAADGELNSTIKDRFFSAASATPCSVFPRLIRLNQHHLGKLDSGIKRFYDIEISAAANKITGFPHLLNLEEQGLFAIGYYHQRQDLYTSKKDKKEGTEE